MKVIVILATLLVAACADSSAPATPSPTATPPSPPPEVVYVQVPARPAPQLTINPLPPIEPANSPPSSYQRTPAASTPPPDGGSYSWIYYQGRWCAVPKPGWTYNNGVPAGYACWH